MKTAAVQAYRTNRERYSLDQLRSYNGKWVAFSGDGRRVVACAESLADAAAQTEATGENPEDVVFEWIELESDEIQTSAGLQ